MSYSKKFGTFRGFQNHLLISPRIRKRTTFDKVRQKWAKLCNKVFLTTKNVAVPLEQPPDKNEHGDTSMGWGLEKGMKTAEFS